MPIRRRQYDKQFKIDAVNQITSGEKSTAEISRELSISPCTLWRWKDELRANPEKAFPGLGRPRNPEHAKGKSLREQLQQVTEERDILRKAIAIIYKQNGFDEGV